MIKCWTAGLAVMLAAAAITASAQEGQPFVNGNLGRANMSGGFQGHGNEGATAWAVRFGYAWRDSALSYGLEAGYADFGKTSQNGTYVYLDSQGKQQQAAYGYSRSIKGWLLGGNLKYDFTSRWYLSARGGWFRSEVTSTSTGFNGERMHGSYADNRWYAGIGTGYNVSKSWSAGVFYDYFDLGSTRYSQGRNYVGAYSVSLEYRF